MLFGNDASSALCTILDVLCKHPIFLSHYWTIDHDVHLAQITSSLRISYNTSQIGRLDWEITSYDIYASDVNFDLAALAKQFGVDVIKLPKIGQVTEENVVPLTRAKKVIITNNNKKQMQMQELKRPRAAKQGGKKPKRQKLDKQDHDDCKSSKPLYIALRRSAKESHLLHGKVWFQKNNLTVAGMNLQHWRDLRDNLLVSFDRTKFQTDQNITPLDYRQGPSTYAGKHDFWIFEYFHELVTGKAFEVTNTHLKDFDSIEFRVALRVIAERKFADKPFAHLVAPFCREYSFEKKAFWSHNAMTQRARRYLEQETWKAFANQHAKLIAKANKANDIMDVTVLELGAKQNTDCYENSNVPVFIQSQETNNSNVDVSTDLSEDLSKSTQSEESAFEVLDSPVKTTKYRSKQPKKNDDQEEPSSEYQQWKEAMHVKYPLLTFPNSMNRTSMDGFVVWKRGTLQQQQQYLNDLMNE